MTTAAIVPAMMIRIAAGLSNASGVTPLSVIPMRSAANPNTKPIIVDKSMYKASKYCILLIISVIS